MCIPNILPNIGVICEYLALIVDPWYINILDTTVYRDDCRLLLKKDTLECEEPNAREH
jgi:hypothetical protein